MRYLIAWALAAVGCLCAFAGYRNDRLWVWIVGWGCFAAAADLVIHVTLHLPVCP
jgi:hypothetical protein